jgi:hypothetical protein
MLVQIMQLFIVTVLMLVLFFGLGFILNMLLKTTWLPLYMYLVLIVGIVIYWGLGTGTLLSNLVEYSVADYIPAISGFIGSMISGYTIQALRIRGFKMF